MTGYNRIKDFWDSQPCGTRHINLPHGSKEYFIEFDKYFAGLYPYLLPILNIPSMKGKRVLVIGLGSGFELHRIAEVAAETIALDISAKTIELCEQRKKHFGIKFTSYNASATDMPFNDSIFNAVVSIGCLHHIPDIQSAVDEIHRVLKPGGRFTGMVYYKNSWRYQVVIPLKKRLSQLYRGKTSQEVVSQMYDWQDNPYGTVYSKPEVKKIFTRFSNFKFRVENFVGHEFIPYLGAHIPRRFWISTLGKIMGLDLYFTATVVKPVRPPPPFLAERAGSGFLL